MACDGLAVGTFWFLAAFVFFISQWVVPAFYGKSGSTGGFDFGTSFALPFIKTWGLRVAGALVLLGPFSAIWTALQRGGDAAIRRALGGSGKSPGKGAGRRR